MRQRTLRLALVAGTLLAGCSAGTSDDGADDSGDDEDAAVLASFTGRQYDAARLPVRLARGDLVRHGAIAALVPPPGEMVTAEGLHIDGSEDVLQIDVAPDGTASVWASAGDAEPAGATTYAAPPPACKDDRFNFFGFRWFGTLEWYFRAGSTPDYGASYGLPVDYAEDMIRKGGQNIVNANNNCGRADHVLADIQYMGRTARATDVTSTGACGDYDGTSVVAFGDFPAGSTLLGVTCTHSVFRQGSGYKWAVESDIRLDKYQWQWWWPGTGPCDDESYVTFLQRANLEAVMTHERGHSFGLAHVQNSLLTMRPSMDVCDPRDITLGLGDMLGLEQLY